MTLLAAVNWRTALFLTIDVSLAFSLVFWVLCSDKRVARIGYLLTIWRARRPARSSKTVRELPPPGK